MRPLQRVYKNLEDGSAPKDYVGFSAPGTFGRGQKSVAHGTVYDSLGAQVRVSGLFGSASYISR